MNVAKSFAVSKVSSFKSDARSSPIVDATEGFLVGHVIHQNETHRAAIISRRYCPISFLAGCVLQFKTDIRNILDHL